MEVGTRFGKYAAKISAGLYIQITEDHNIHKTRHDTREQENQNLDLQYGIPTKKQHLNEKDPETKEITTT